MLTTTLIRRDAPRAARRTVADCCLEADAGPVCTDGAAVMTSELVTNALLHGTGPITLGVDCGPAQVRVEVGDADPRRPALPAADDASESGRGLLIVDALARSWGVDDASPGKTVWFEIDAQP